jgi:hypothetical protein
VRARRASWTRARGAPATPSFGPRAPEALRLDNWAPQRAQGGRCRGTVPRLNTSLTSLNLVANNLQEGGGRALAEDCASTARLRRSTSERQCASKEIVASMRHPRRRLPPLAKACVFVCVCVTVCSPAPLSPILHLPPGDNLVAMAATSYYNNNNCSPVSSLEQAARPLLPCVGIDHSHSSSTTHHRTFNSIGFAVLRINPTNEIPLNTYTHTIKRCGVLLQLRSDAAREGEVANTRNPPPQAEEAPGKSFHTNE